MAFFVVCFGLWGFCLLGVFLLLGYFFFGRLWLYLFGEGGRGCSVFGFVFAYIYDKFGVTDCPWEKKAEFIICFDE